MNQQPVHYENAAVRGKIRAWKNQLHRRYQGFDGTYRAVTPRSPLGLACVDFVKRNSDSGRQRALAKLRQAFEPAAKLETVRIEGKHPYAIWSILKPRDPVSINADDASGRNQFCVTLNYIMAGFLPVLGTINCAEGLWTLEIPDHALGRAVERSGMLQPETIIRDAHRNLLELPGQLVALNNGAIDPKRGFYVKAGAGAFRCNFVLAEDVSIAEELGCSIFTPTWIDNARLYEDQIPLCEKGESGQRLGDSWLLPMPLRWISKTTAGCAEVRVWEPA
jgi:hypothetical protein